MNPKEIVKKAEKIWNFRQEKMADEEQTLETHEEETMDAEQSTTDVEQSADVKQEDSTSDSDKSTEPKSPSIKEKLKTGKTCMDKVVCVD